MVNNYDIFHIYLFIVCGAGVSVWAQEKMCLVLVLKLDNAQICFGICLTCVVL